MRHRIQRDASLQSRQIVSEVIRGPGVRRFMDRQRKDQRDHVEEKLYDYAAVQI